MWKAEDGKNSQRPAEWLRQVDTKKFLKSLGKKLGIPEKDTVEAISGGAGGGGGTYGHYQVALAYAKYLSPEFHIWCNEVVKQHIE